MDAVQSSSSAVKQFRIVVTVLWLRVLDCLCHEGRCRDPAPPNGVEDCGAERLQATWCRDVNMLALWLAKPDPRFPGAKSPWQPEERWNSCTSRVGRRRRQHSEIAARERWSPSITFAKQETGADLVFPLCSPPSSRYPPGDTLFSARLPHVLTVCSRCVAARSRVPSCRP